ncbi:hypothetical protein F5Y17DRAFT_438041 [Xylariaceae sp. FL0594]|nr:hypothetical protein F5Y17DRAFT_438041 [Xylariaceae sp. FL0594]
MEQVASALLAFPPQDSQPKGTPDAQNEAYHKAATLHVQKLRELIKDRGRDLVLHSNNLLSVLDPATHSLSYLAVVYKLSLPTISTDVPRGFVHEKLRTILTKLDGRQCRYAGYLLKDLLNAVAGGTLSLPPPVAVEVLSSALRSLDPSGRMFTHLHLPLAKLAYESGAIEPALPTINSDIVFYPGMGSSDHFYYYVSDMTLAPPFYMSVDTGLTENVTGADVVEYNMLCGLIHCARRDWEKAHAAFQQVASHPTKENGCSPVMVDGYKKGILVGLLAKGVASAEVPQVTAFVNSAYFTAGKEYAALATAFASDDVQQLIREAHEHSQLWEDDGNAALLGEVLASYQKWRILSLRDVYTKLSLPEIRRQTKSGETGEELPTDEDVETIVQNMIVSGMLSGVIEKNDDGTKFLTFLPAGTELSEDEFARELSGAQQQVESVRALLKATNRRLATSKQYIKWAIREDRRDKTVDTHETTPAFPYDSQLMDEEDLMGGIEASG